MSVKLNYSLTPHNTFGFTSHAQYAWHIQEEADLLKALALCKDNAWQWRVLGGGSNVVLEPQLQGLTLLMEITGKRLFKQTPTHWIIEVGAGENWHEFVAWTIGQGYFGLENLALIPGTCGAAPIQNIGAYGAEVGNFIESVRVLDTENLQNAAAWLEIKQAQCHFSYRNSFFKEKAQRYIVTHVTFALPKKWIANLSYAELNQSVRSLGKDQATIQAQDIFEAVCAIRQAKLPDPAVIGNAGSFFHNPIIDGADLERLKKQYPSLVSYPTNAVNGEARYKLAAGWLIDHAGLKGYRQGNVGVYEKQALVLVNHGNGTSHELLSLAQEIKAKIFATYGVTLSQEPVIFS